MPRTYKVSLRNISFFIFTTVSVWAYPFGPPNGYTIAPGDKPGVACTQCHTGTALNGGGGDVRIAFVNGLTYTPGQTQTFNIVITDSVAATFGFEMSTRMESAPDSRQAGSFTAGVNQKVVCSDNNPQPAGGCGGAGVQWIKHSQPSLSNTIAVQWTAPAAASGNLHLYVSANAANGDNSSRGDHIYVADYVLTPASAASSGIPTVTSVVNAASGTPGAEAGSWITINGTNFASSAVTWDNFIIGVVFPTTVGGVTVSIDGRPAPIAFVNQTQINVLVPATPTLGDVSVVVNNGIGSSVAAALTLAPLAPALFTYSQNQGRYPAAIVYDSGTAFHYLAPAGLLGAAVPSRPAKPGDTIVLYGTAFGRTTTLLNPEWSASVAFPLAHTGSDIAAQLAIATIGGQAATLQFCGIVSPGVYQINVVVPQGLTPGDQPLTVTFLSGPTLTQTLFIPVG